MASQLAKSSLATLKNQLQAAKNVIAGEQEKLDVLEAQIAALEPLANPPAPASAPTVLPIPVVATAAQPSSSSTTPASSTAPTAAPLVAVPAPK